MTQPYYGTKRIMAWPSEKDGQSGYGITYEGGYQSWSPKDVFEKSYQPINAMSFGHAIQAMKEGHKVQRAGWNGKGMFLYLVDGSHFKVNQSHLLRIYPEGKEIYYLPHIDMKTADGSCVPWLASQTDMLENDWAIDETPIEHESN